MLNKLTEVFFKHQLDDTRTPFSPLDIKIALQKFESSPRFGLVSANEVLQYGHGSLPPRQAAVATVEGP